MTDRLIKISPERTFDHPDREGPHGEYVLVDVKLLDAFLPVFGRMHWGGGISPSAAPYPKPIDQRKATINPPGTPKADPYVHPAALLWSLTKLADRLAKAATTQQRLTTEVEQFRSDREATRRYLGLDGAR